MQVHPQQTVPIGLHESAFSCANSEQVTHTSRIQVSSRTNSARSIVTATDIWASPLASEFNPSIGRRTIEQPTQTLMSTEASGATTPSKAPLLKGHGADNAAVLHTKGASGTFPEVRPGADILYCVEPLTVLGVQNDTPVAFSKDGQLISFVTANHAIYVLKWTADQNRFVIWRLLNGHNASVKALTFHPKDDNCLVSAGPEGIFVWDITNQRTRRRLELAMPGTSEPGHESDVECLCWIYDGTCLLSGSKDTNIKVWDATNNYTLMETIFGHKAPVLSIVFDANNHRFASAGRDSTIKLFDAHTLQLSWRPKRREDKGIVCVLLGNMDGHRGDVTALCWSRDGLILFSGARDNTIKAWNVQNTTEIRTIQDKTQGQRGKHMGDIRRIMIVPKKRLPPKQSSGPASNILSAGDQSHGVENDNEYMDGLVTCSQDGRVNIWRLQEFSVNSFGARPATTNPDEAQASESDGLDNFSPTAAGAAAGQDGGNGEGDWDSKTKTILDEILNGGGVEAVLGSDDLTDALVSSQPLFEEGIGVHAMDMAPGGAIIACSSTENSLRLYAAGNLGRLAPVQGFHGHMESVTSLKVLPGDKEILTSSFDNRVCKYNTKTIERSLAIKSMCSVTALTTSPVVNRPEQSNMKIDAAPFIFAACADYIIRCYSSKPEDYGSMINSYHQQWAQGGFTGSMLQIPPHAYEAARYQGHAGRVDTLAINNTGTIMVSGGRDFDMLIWSLENPRPAIATSARDENAIPVASPMARIDAHYGHISALQFCPVDGCVNQSEDLLASGGNDHAIKVWSMKSSGNLSKVWEATQEIEDGAHAGAISAIAWGRGPSAGLLFSGSWDRSLKVWSGGKLPGHRSNPNQMLLGTVCDHNARISAIDTTNCGKYVISCSLDFSALVYSTQAPYQLLARYMATRTDGGLTSISAGNSIFVTGGESGSIRVWPMYGTEKYRGYFRQNLDGVDRDAYFMLPDAKQNQDSREGYAVIDLENAAAASTEREPTQPE